MRDRAVFFGTPAFAVPSLEALTSVADVVGVICQPDRPQGRGMVMTPCAVKERALALGLDVMEPLKLRDGTVAAMLRDRKVDVAVVVAYGRILPEDVLAAPRLGCVNVHGSLLPRYRGAAPVTWAIVRGEAKSGVTLMKLDAGMDTGPMLGLLETPIGPEETAGDLSVRLAALGRDAVLTLLPQYLRGELRETPQDDSQATLAPILAKKDGVIRWDGTALEVHNHVRGMTPWPGAQTTLNGKVIKVLATKPAWESDAGAPAGTVVIADKSRVVVACGHGGIELTSIQLEGKKPIRGLDWAVGRGVSEGARLGS